MEKRPYDDIEREGGFMEILTPCDKFERKFGFDSFSMSDYRSCENCRYLDSEGKCRAKR